MELGEATRLGLSRRDVAWAAALALATAVLYALTWQTRFYGDGPGLASFHVLGTGQGYYNALYLPTCRLVAKLVGDGDPFLAPRLVSLVPAGLGVGLGFLNCRLCGASLLGALVAMGLLVLSPALWFFGTTVEVHALLFAVVELVAFVALLAPWRRPWLALALVAAVFPLLFLAHQATFTLGLGFVFLVQYARARHGTRFTWPQLFLVVGPVLLLALLAGVACAYWIRLGSLASIGKEVQQQIQLQTVQGPEGFLHHKPVWSQEWLLPLGVLVPLAAAGWWRLRRERELSQALLVLLLVPTAFFLWWGVYENGGYFLGSDPFLVLCVAGLFVRVNRSTLALAATVLVAQALFARARIDDYDHGWVPSERVQMVEQAVGAHGLLISSVGFTPDIRCYLPDVKELSLPDVVRGIWSREQRAVDPEEILALILPHLERLRQKHGRLALETGYQHVSDEDLPTMRLFRPIFTAVEAELRARYVVTELPHPCWSMLVLEQPR